MCTFCVAMTNSNSLLFIHQFKLKKGVSIYICIPFGARKISLDHTPTKNLLNKRTPEQ